MRFAHGDGGCLLLMPGVDAGAGESSHWKNDAQGLLLMTCLMMSAAPVASEECIAAAAAAALPAVLWYVA